MKNKSIKSSIIIKEKTNSILNKTQLSKLMFIQFRTASCHLDLSSIFKYVQICKQHQLRLFIESSCKKYFTNHQVHVFWNKMF